MTWEPGRERVRQLIDDGEVEQVPVDLEVARRMLADAGRHLATANANGTVYLLRVGLPSPGARKRWRKDAKGTR